MNKTERCLRNEERSQLKRYKDECIDFPTRQMSDEEFAKAQKRREKYLAEREKQERIDREKYKNIVGG